jgi:HEPN domain-containing protein
MDKQTAYWLAESLENLDTAKVLYSNKKYLEAAFFCHLSMEKMLKGFFVKRMKSVPHLN